MWKIVHAGRPRHGQLVPCRPQPTTLLTRAVRRSAPRLAPTRAMVAGHFSLGPRKCPSPDSASAAVTLAGDEHVAGAREVLELARGKMSS